MKSKPSLRKEILMPFEIKIPNDEPAKISCKHSGLVEAYAANTNKGLVNSFNSDRISIVTNLYPPKERRHEFRMTKQGKMFDTDSTLSDQEL